MNLGPIELALSRFGSCSIVRPPRLFYTLYAQMLKEYPDINDQTDQFIFRLNKEVSSVMSRLEAANPSITLQGKPLHEQLVRLENGYPTTEREVGY